MELVVDADEEAGEDEEAVSRAARALVASRRTERVRNTVIDRQHRHRRLSQANRMLTRILLETTAHHRAQLWYDRPGSRQHFFPRRN